MTRLELKGRDHGKNGCGIPTTWRCLGGGKTSPADLEHYARVFSEALGRTIRY